jgi:hypothetical protein
MVARRSGGCTPVEARGTPYPAPMSNSTPPRRGGALTKVLIVLALLVVVVVVGGVLLIDSIARAGIAAAGTYSLGARTSVREASIGIVSGKTVIRGLEVDNPKGYAQDVKFVSLGEIAVDAGFANLTGEKIVIDRVALSDLVVDIEKGADGTLNVNAIVDSIKKATGADKPVDQPADKPTDAPKGEPKEAIIKELRLERVTVNLRNLVGGKDGVVEVKLPDIMLRDLSSKGGIDVLASEVSGVVIASVMQAVVAANIEGLGADVLGGLQGAVDGLGEAIGGPLKDAVGKGIEGAAAALQDVGKGLGDVGKKIGEEAGKALEGAGDAVKKGVGDAIDGIFGGKK